MEDNTQKMELTIGEKLRLARTSQHLTREQLSARVKSL